MCGRVVQFLYAVAGPGHDFAAVTGDNDGADDGAAVGTAVGTALGATVGVIDGLRDENAAELVGATVGTADGPTLGAKLGTLDEKVDRVQSLAAELCQYVPGTERDRVCSAARLCKADLSTDMVGEFPDLQGVMGCYYALADGEAPEIAAAIAEHYAPQGPDDTCPSAPDSVAVALADKIDTLVGLSLIHI